MSESKRFRTGPTLPPGINAFDLRLLRSCLAFRTIDEHADFFVRLHKLPLAHMRQAAMRLQYAVAQGWLVEEKEFRKSVWHRRPSAAQASTETSAGIEVIGIQTCDRPEELKRLLESLVLNLTTHNRSPEIVISDDSSPALFAANDATIAHLRNGGYRGKLTHLSRQDRATLAATISRKAGVDADMSTFALCPDMQGVNQCGAGRNTLLLYAAGRKLLMLDDDVVLRIHRPRTESTDLRVSSLLHGYTYFDSQADALEYFPSAEADFLKHHEAWLGRSVSSVLQEFGSDNTLFDEAPGGLTNRLFKEIQDAAGSVDPNARIFLTQSGSVGDSWSRYHSPFDVSFPRDGHDLCGRSPEQFLKNTVTPFVSRVDTSHVLYCGPACIGLTMGIDARTLTPPFPPLYRGQDNLFGYLAHQCLPSVFSLRFPWAVEHRRPDARTRNPDVFAPLLSVAVITRMMCDVALRNSTATTAVQKMTELGHHLNDMGRALSADTETLVREEMVRAIHSICSFASVMKVHYEGVAPSWWLEEMDRIAASADTYNKEIRLKPLFSDAPTLSLPEWLQCLGKLLTCWPDMFAAARTL